MAERVKKTTLFPLRTELLDVSDITQSEFSEWHILAKSVDGDNVIKAKINVIFDGTEIQTTDLYGVINKGVAKDDLAFFFEKEDDNICFKATNSSTSNQYEVNTYKTTVVFFRGDAEKPEDILISFTKKLDFKADGHTIIDEALIVDDGELKLKHDNFFSLEVFTDERRGGFQLIEGTDYFIDGYDDRFNTYNYLSFSASFVNIHFDEVMFVHYKTKGDYIEAEDINVKKTNFIEKSAFNKDFGRDFDTVAEGNHLHDDRYSIKSELYDDVTEVIENKFGDGEHDIARGNHIHSQYKLDFFENTAFNKNFGLSSQEVARGSHNHDERYEPKRTYLGTAYNKDFGVEAGTVARGEHSHTFHVDGPELIGQKSAFNKEFGTGLDEVCQGNDARVVSAYTHISNQQNPHKVTKEQIGLKNVINKRQLTNDDISTSSTLTNEGAMLVKDNVIKGYIDNVFLGINSATYPPVDDIAGLRTYTYSNPSYPLKHNALITVIENGQNYRFDTQSISIDDGLNVVKPAAINASSPGRWIRITAGYNSHNTLNGIQGGNLASNQFFHLTSDEYNNIRSVSTSSNNGFMSAEQANKLEVLEPYVHPDIDGLKHVPANGDDANNNKFLRASATAGQYNWSFLNANDIPNIPADKITSGEINPDRMQQIFGDTEGRAFPGNLSKMAYTHATLSHAPSNAEKNQNAFSYIFAAPSNLLNVSVWKNEAMQELNTSERNISSVSDTDAFGIGVSGGLSIIKGKVPSSSTNYPNRDFLIIKNNAIMQLKIKDSSGTESLVRNNNSLSEPVSAKDIINIESGNFINITKPEDSKIRISTTIPNIPNTEYSGKVLSIKSDKGLEWKKADALPAKPTGTFGNFEKRFLQIGRENNAWTNESWGTVREVPANTGNSGVLITNGTVYGWATIKKSGEGTFKSDSDGEKTTITHDLNLTDTTKYNISITPKITNDIDAGRVGEYYISKKESNSFEVKNTGIAGIKFEWILVINREN